MRRETRIAVWEQRQRELTDRLGQVICDPFVSEAESKTGMGTHGRLYLSIHGGRCPKCGAEV